jgi:mRNA interferase HicA
MKRDEFIKLLSGQGCILLRHGGRYDIYMNPATGQKQPIPRHAEIDDDLAKHILKFIGLKR